MSVAWALSSQSSVTVRAARRLRQALNVEKAIDAHGGPAHRSNHFKPTVRPQGPTPNENVTVV